MSGDNETTLGNMITMLHRLVSELPDGADTPVEFAICDGENLQIIDQVDVSPWFQAGKEGVGRQFVLLRGHHHPGSQPGRLLRSATSDIDADLQKLIAEGDDPS